MHDAPPERWFFYQDTIGLWKWARLDIVGTVLDHSGVAFETREECVDHARGSGYAAPVKAKTPDPIQDFPAAAELRATPI